MKNIQTSALKIVCALLLILSATSAYCQSQKITRADSLFKAKQYTQSLEIYQYVFAEKKYTPAMLLKMAYINEGLGKPGVTLYYLKLYYLSTNDDQALKKSEEIAAKYRLAGYETNDASRLKHWLSNNMIFIQLALAAFLLGAAAIVWVQQKQRQNPWGAFAGMIIIAGALFFASNFFWSTSVIVSSHKAYLMSGPSAGSTVVAVIEEGNLITSTGQQDVWLKVKWTDKEVFVKENEVLKVEI
ncbi:MAG TPA: hypothetical protein VL728_16430 [Cyclobacteriaceae bacterium]|jgi:hypothetical protein|nr:hypothetical protein [Cyclobacteriaceae bacterium]